MRRIKSFLMALKYYFFQLNCNKKIFLRRPVSPQYFVIFCSWKWSEMAPRKSMKILTTPSSIQCKIPIFHRARETGRPLKYSQKTEKGLIQKSFLWFWGWVINWQIECLWMWN
jgi:hypothetical protein